MCFLIPNLQQTADGDDDDGDDDYLFADRSMCVEMCVLAMLLLLPTP